MTNFGEQDLNYVFCSNIELLQEVSLKEDKLV